MSVSVCFILAKRRGEHAELTAERLTMNSGTLMDMIAAYHSAIGEEDPSFHWLEDTLDIATAGAVVDADACSKPDTCLRTLKAFRDGIAKHAAILPPFTWITERRADGVRGHSTTSARVKFEGEEWVVPGGWEPTMARQVTGGSKKPRTVDLRSVASWGCNDSVGQPMVLEFDRHSYGAFVDRDLTAIIRICDAARKQRGLVAIASVL